MEYRSGTCSTCGTSFKISASFPHTRVRCKSCGTAVEVGLAATDDLPEGLVPHVPSGRKRPGPSMKDQLLARRAAAGEPPAEVPEELPPEAPKPETRRPASPRAPVRPSAPATPRRNSAPVLATEAEPIEILDADNGHGSFGAHREHEHAADVEALDPAGIDLAAGEREQAADEHAFLTAPEEPATTAAADGFAATPEFDEPAPLASDDPLAADDASPPAEAELATEAEPAVATPRPARTSRERSGRGKKDRKRSGGGRAAREPSSDEPAEEAPARESRGGRSKGRRSRGKGAEKKKLPRPVLIGIVAVIVLGLCGFLFKDALFGANDVEAATPEAAHDASAPAEASAGETAEPAPTEETGAEAGSEADADDADAVDETEPTPPAADEPAGDEADETDAEEAD